MSVEKANEKKPANDNIKNFWLYALILFSAALILIMVSDYFQGRYVDQIKKDLQTKNIDITTNMTMVQNVQKLNEQLTARVAEVEKQLKEQKEAIEIKDSTIKLSEQNLKAMKIIGDTQALYIKKSYTAAKTKLKELDRDTLSDEVLPSYDAVYKLLYK